MECLRRNPCERADWILCVLLISAIQPCSTFDRRLCRFFRSEYGAVIVRVPPDRLGIANCLYFSDFGFLYRTYDIPVGVNPRISATSWREVAALSLLR